MAIVSISEAARLTGKSTKTLYRMASQGKLSVSHGENGAKNVDISELARVFGQLQPTGEALIETDFDSRLRQLETENAELRQAAALTDVLKAEQAGLKALLAAREEQLQDMRQTLRLLEHTPAKRRWWHFGR